MLLAWFWTQCTVYGGVSPPSPRSLESTIQLALMFQYTDSTLGAAVTSTLRQLILQSRNMSSAVSFYSWWVSCVS